MLFAAIAFALLVGTTAHSVVRPGVVATGLTLAAALLWLPADSPVEGWVLVRLGDGHGITIADLLSVLAMLIALASWAAGSASAEAVGQIEAAETDDRERTPS